MRLPGRQDPLQRQVRKPADQRAPLWRMLQPLRRGRGVRGWGVRRRLPARRLQGGTVNPDTCECVCPSGTMLCFDEACISTECDPGSAFNPDTCMCEVTAVCPSEQCCCSCVYRDATGALVSTCVAPFADDAEACITLCNTQTPPPGTTFEDQEFICSIVADAVPVCTPASTGTGMTCGANVPCRPPA